MPKILTRLAIAAVALQWMAACKFNTKSDDESHVAADSTKEVKNTAEFYHAVWDQEFIVKFSDLPESGAAAATPYSGHWYPEANGGTNARATVGGAALDKYDKAFYQGNRRAALWEARNHGFSDTQWAGHCNGFSAASARHKEPQAAVVRAGVRFEPNDIKALLAEIYMSANYFFLGGQRCENPTLRGPNPDTDRAAYNTMGDCEDVNPGTFHVSIANWIGKLSKPLIFDEARFNQVWNYPLYRYSSSSTVVSTAAALQIIGSRKKIYVFNEKAVKLMHVRTTITYADALPFEVVPGGTDAKDIDLQYILELNAEGQIIGGEWALVSRDEHPDFIWAPLEPMQGQNNRTSGNPYLSVPDVLGMWAESAGYRSLDDAPKQLAGGTWTSEWGKYTDFSVKLDGASRGSLLLAEDGNTLSIIRGAGTPKIAVGLNSEAQKEVADKDNIQTFTIKPVPGINWATLTYVVDGKESSETLLMHALR
jgi:hypothetical protein